MLNVNVQILWVALFLVSISSANIHAEQLLKATYKGRHTGITVTLVRTLEQHSDTAFTLNSKASSFVGSISEQSQFSLIDHQLVPHRYDFLRRVLGKKSKQHLSFDWKNQIARYQREDKPEKNKDFELPTNALDPSLYQIKLQQEASTGATQFSFDYAKDGKMKKLEFRITGDTTYKLDEKELPAIELERTNTDGKKQTKIILIPSLNYQIASIAHTDKKGSTHTLSLKDYQGNPELISGFYRSIASPTQ